MPVSRGSVAWPVLLGCVWLWAGPALAEVGTFDKCRQNFYKETSPNGFVTNVTADICQRYRNRYHYASLYDKANRIPLWSAYTLNPNQCSEQPKRRSKWFVEPQLFHPDKSPDMTTEAASTLSKDELRSSQAINEDYEDTSYDRGHLNPNAFQCNEGRTATFTLTNAAPMDPCFNRIHWSQLEQALKAQLIEKCGREEQTGYLVTGTVPNGNVKIPMQSEDEEGDRSRPFNRVSVPSHVWTAVCCDDIDSSQKFSFAFLAKNGEESSLEEISVEKLNAALSHLYRRQVTVFADECGSKNNKTEEVSSAVRSALYSSLQILLSDRHSQLFPGRKRSRLDLETTRVMGSQNLDQNSLELTKVRFLVGFPNLSEWQKTFTNLYIEDNLACVLTPAAAAAKDSGTSDPVCTLQEQKHLLNAHVTAQGWSCVGVPCGKHGYAYSWCYTSHNNDWDYCCTSKCSVNRRSGRYECSRGDGYTTSCSPQYSAVTVSGKPCQADHPCGLYGKGYYWCYTDYKQNWEYCCSPQHYCGYHTYSYQWCYTEDAKGSSKYCTPYSPIHRRSLESEKDPVRTTTNTHAPASQENAETDSCSSLPPHCSGQPGNGWS